MNGRRGGCPQLISPLGPSLRAGRCPLRPLQDNLPCCVHPMFRAICLRAGLRTFVDVAYVKLTSMEVVAHHLWKWHIAMQESPYLSLAGVRATCLVHVKRDTSIRFWFAVQPEAAAQRLRASSGSPTRCTGNCLAKIKLLCTQPCVPASSAAICIDRPRPQNIF